MGLRIWRRFQIVPGVRANISRHGISLSLGHRHAWFTVGSRGARATVGGHGIFWTEHIPPGAPVHHGHRLLTVIVVLVILAAVFHH